MLVREGARLELRALHRKGYGAIYADWADDEMRRRIAAGKRQPLARAAGLHKKPGLQVLDASGGLGRDAFTLAALGAQVTLAERNSRIAELLRDAWHRALDDERLHHAAMRVEIVQADSRDLMRQGRHWDTVYLDPMYPEDGKAALPGKEMQILRDLTGGDADADGLLPYALACARLRVVVKRPLRAPWLGGMQPDLDLRTTQLRFDIHLIAGTEGGAERS